MRGNAEGSRSGSLEMTNHEEAEESESEKEVKEEGRVVPIPLHRWVMHGAVMFGREFCYAMETALVTPLLLKIGLPEQYYSLTWLLSPITGLFVTPVIGSMSDRCTHRWGRRRPFILALSVGVLLGLVLFLNGSLMGLTFGDRPNSQPIGIILTVSGVVVMDFSAEAAEGPIRAYLLDVARTGEQDMPLNIHAVSAGLGGVVGYMMGGLDWTDTALGQAFKSQEQVLFLFASIIFIVSLVLHMLSIPERPFTPSDQLKVTNSQSTCKPTGQIPAFLVIEEEDASAQGNNESGLKVREMDFLSVERVQSLKNSTLTMPGATSDLDPDQLGTGSSSPFCGPSRLTVEPKYPVLADPTNCPCSDIQDSSGSQDSHQRQPSFIFSYGRVGSHRYRLRRAALLDSRPITTSRSLNDHSDLQQRADRRRLHLSSSSLSSESSSSDGGPDGVATFRLLCLSMFKMPRQLRRLCLCHLLTWFSFTALAVFYTDFMGQVIFLGDPTAPANSTELHNYNRGVQMGCWGLVVYAATAVICSAIFQKCRKKFDLSIKVIYIVGTVSFTAGTASMAIFPNVYVSMVMISTMGIISMSISYCPYALLGQYHEMKEYIHHSPANTRRGYGTDCAILICQVYISQILVASALGPMVDAVGSVHVIPVVASVVAFLSFLTACFLVIYPDKARSSQQHLDLSGDSDRNGGAASNQ